MRQSAMLSYLLVKIVSKTRTLLKFELECMRQKDFLNDVSMKCVLWNVGHFVQASKCQLMCHQNVNVLTGRFINSEYKS